MTDRKRSDGFFSYDNYGLSYGASISVNAIRTTTIEVVKETIGNTAAKTAIGRLGAVTTVGVGLVDVADAARSGDIKGVAVQSLGIGGALAGASIGFKLGASATITLGPLFMTATGIVGSVAGALAGEEVVQAFADQMLSGKPEDDGFSGAAHAELMADIYDQAYPEDRSNPFSLPHSLNQSPEASPSRRPTGRDLHSSSMEPNRSPGMLGGRTNAADSNQSRSTRSDSIGSFGGDSTSRGVGSREAAEAYGRNTASGSNSRGSRRSLANSPEASPSQRSGARDRDGGKGSTGESPVLFNLNGDGFAVTERDDMFEQAQAVGVTAGDAALQPVAVDEGSGGAVRIWRRAKAFLTLVAAIRQWAAQQQASPVFVHVMTGSNLASTDRLMKAAGAQCVGGSYVV